MKKRLICYVIAILSIFIIQSSFQSSLAYAVNSQEGESLNITSKSALLLDYDTGTILYEKNANERLPIASMTKLASLAIVFDSLDKGIIKENDNVVVSENAAAVGGSSAFLDAGASYKVSDLIKTVIIASANDSTVALAEFVAGSEESFVVRMNKLVEKLNLKDTNFINSTGLPAENHYSSAHDIAKIYKLICNNELYKKDAKIWMEDFIHPSGRKTGLVNTNRLVKTFDGIEGGKTGYTDKARFCLTASAKRENLRVVGVIIGANDSKTRFAEMSKLLSYGFANYSSKYIVNSEAPIAIHKFKSAKNQVNIYAKNDIIKLMKKSDDEKFTTDYQIEENLKAPIKAGTVVGKMFVFDKNNMVVDEVELVVKETAESVGVIESLRKVINNW